MADIGENVEIVKAEPCVPLPAGTMKRAALAYAEQGLAVFPCHHVTPTGACSCSTAGCKSPGKHPMTSNGFADATADVKTVADWWSDWPDANIGLPCSTNFLAVVDIDPRNGGDATFADLETTHGPIASSCMADTGGGGRHVVFSFAGPKGVDLPGKLGPGVDLKWRGYIIAAPSNHVSGGRYTWRDGMAPVADESLGGLMVPVLPAWVRDAKQARTKPATTSKPLDLGWYRFAAATMAVPNTGDEYDRDGWLRIGAAIHAQAAGSEDGLALFLEWSAAHPTFDAAETERVYQSFSSSRTGSAVTGATVLHEAKAAGHVLPARQQTTGEAFGAVDDEAQSAKTGASDYGTAVNPNLPTFRFETSCDLEAEADVESVFLVDELIEAGTLFMLYGNPGAGKSAIVLDMLLRIAHGLPWAGRRTERVGVLYICPEGPKGLKRRYRAWHAHARAEGHTVGGAPFEVLRQQVDLFSSDVAIKAIAERIRTFRRRHGVACGIVVIDTLRQALVGGDENSARDIGTFTAKLTRLRDSYNVVCGFVHHDGKDASRGAAGSTAIVGNIDIELVVDKPKGSRSGTIRAGKMRDGYLDGKVPYELRPGIGETRPDGTTKSAVVAVVGMRSVDPSASLGDVSDEADAPTLETADAPVAVLIDLDDDDARDAMMMQAARSLGQAFSRRDLYAAVRNLRTAAKLDRPDISDTRLDAVRMRLQLRGDIMREGEGKSSRWIAQS